MSEATDLHRKARRRPRRPGRKLLGLDLGERRIGVAVSDDTGVIASPLTIVDLRRGTIEDIARVAAEQRVDGIVAGLPIGMSGEEGFQAQDVRAQCGDLAILTSIPIVFWDERFTSSIAEDLLSRRGIPARDRKGKLDAIAAAVMLQSYLDAHPISPGRSCGG